jgi:aryl-alcohol dehydrogenase-like predicted oxidoreductase
LDAREGEDLVPIPDTKRRKYLEENAAAVNIQLTPDDVAELEDAVPVEGIGADEGD